MVALELQEDQSARFVELLQPDSVLGIDGGLPQGEDVVLGSGDVELEVLGLSGLNHGILGSISGWDEGKKGKCQNKACPVYPCKLDHDEVFELAEILGIAWVLLGFLVVDLGQEGRLLYVEVKVHWIMPIL